MACMKVCNGSSSNSGSDNSSGKSGVKNTGGVRKGEAGCDDVCGYYGKKGHWAASVTGKKRDEEA
jgi:hypothetical protein